MEPKVGINVFNRNKLGELSVRWIDWTNATE
jgi:hypothetical protein